MAAFSSSSMACSASTSYPYYHVFTNHRGPDVKATFASNLYHRLISHGLQVFLDKPEMQPGHEILSQIEAAIGVASVHVAIFSPTYAESKWCLNELLQMVESVDSRGAVILPVFYKVKPSDLRFYGAYAKDLRNHEEKKRHDLQTTQKWRDALDRVAGISGFELEAFNGNEEELLDQVVETVLKKVPKIPLDVAKYPTGLGEKLQDFQTAVLLQQEEERREARVVGIVGLGGIGKTTLAKEFFNCKRSEYSGSSFLFDVRENAAKMSLNTLQSKLIKDLKGRVIQIDSCEEGIGQLKHNLKACHALIIIDDIDHVDQLDVFLPIKNVLHPKSLILITTRDNGVLKKGAKMAESSIYHLKGLNRSHSQQLFCSHAFSLSYPPEEYEILVDGFLKACDGLPLSLRVFGALLYGEDDQSYWNEVLDGLNHILPDDIQNRLRISYESLNEEEKNIFLDIACFAIGEDRDKWITIWGGSGWKGLVGFRNLQCKCLVEVEVDIVRFDMDTNGSMGKLYRENKIRMHDHLRDLGREIANKMANSRSMAHRVWDPRKNLHDLLEQSSSVITEVRGIRMPHLYRGETCNEELLPPNYSSSQEVLGIRKLQLLDAEGDFVERMLSWVRSPNALIWLCWKECPRSSLPSWIPMQHLRVLAMSGSKLERLWEFETQAPLLLRELKISAPLSEFPKAVGQLKQLQKILVTAYGLCLPTLTTLPEEFYDLCSLKYLVLADCTSLKRLEDSLGNLTNLQHINLSGCASLKMLPKSLGNLSKLEHLDLSLCNSLEMLPDSLGKLTNIQHIDLSQCSSLAMLPDCLEILKNVQDFDLKSCSSLKMLPESLGNMTNLQTLSLGWCQSLKALPNSLGILSQLKHLHLAGCSSLTISDESLGNITTLECLDLQDCCQMKLLPPQVGRQQCLQKINLLGTDLEELPSDVACLSNLEVLRLGSPSLELLPPSVGFLTSLKELWFHGCQKLQCLPDSLGRLTQLEELSIRKCGIQYLPTAVMKMNNLKVLKIFECPLCELPFKKDEGERDTLLVPESSRGKGAKLSELHSSIEKGMAKLEQLWLSKIDISEVPFPEGVASNLQDLRISCCVYLEEIGALPATLKSLDLRFCPALRKVGGLPGPRELKYLSIRDCNVEVDKLSGRKSLLDVLKRGAEGSYGLPKDFCG